MENMF